MKNETVTITYVVDPITAFPEVEKVLYDVAWQFANAYPITFEECKSEAFAAFMKACQDYNAAKGMKFSSWARYWAWCKLKDLVMKRSGDRITFTDDIGEDALTCATPLPALDLVTGLPDDAKEIIGLFLEAPAELLGLSATPKQLVDKVKKYLLTKRNWNAERFDATFAATRAHLQQAWA